MAILTHDFSKFVLLRCQGTFRPAGKKIAYNLLSMSKVTLNPAYEYIDVNAYDDAETVLVDQLLKSKACSLSITMDEKNEISWRAQNGDNRIGVYNSQVAGAMQTFSVPSGDVWFDPISPGIYQIIDAAGQPVQNISVVVVKYGKDDEDADIVLTAGTHYKLNALTGIIELIAAPDNLETVTALTGTYTKAVVDVSHRLIDIGGMQGDGLKGSLTLLGVNRGFLWRLDIPQVRLQNDGDVDLQTIDGISQSTLKGTIIKTANLDGIAVPEAYQFYRLQQLLNPA